MVICGLLKADDKMYVEKPNSIPSAPITGKSTSLGTGNTKLLHRDNKGQYVPLTIQASKVYRRKDIFQVVRANSFSRKLGEKKKGPALGRKLDSKVLSLSPLLAFFQTELRERICPRL